MLRNSLRKLLLALGLPTLAVLLLFGLISYGNTNTSGPSRTLSSKEIINNGDDIIPCPTDLVIPNGYAKINKDSRSVTYYCTGNFQVIGSSSAECQQDGTWSSPPPKCVVPCPTDMAIPNGYAKINKDSRSVTYYCTGNFQIIGSSSAKCQQDGTWSSSLPKCVVPCPTDLVIPNGYAKFSTDSRSVTYYCARNFKFIGSRSAECQQDGTWSSPPPKCILIIVPCPTDLVIPNGYAKFSKDGRSITYHCVGDLKVIGSSSAECQQDGTWSSPLPKCGVLVSCPTDLIIPNGYTKFSMDNRSVTYHCARNFKVIGSSSAECQQDGTWSSSLPYCITSQGCQAESKSAMVENLLYVAKRSHKKFFNKYVQQLPSSTINCLSQQLGISSLTSMQLRYDFMKCPGLTLYKFFSDSEGNIQVPKPFHNCKEMSFRDSGAPTLLVSFPGSGNSWVRQLLESTTGIYTGSVFCDLDYIKNGMLGEGVHSENVLAIKFHFGQLPTLPIKKIMYVIRNPYDAILAEYKRYYLSERVPNRTIKVDSNAHISELSDESYSGEDWIKYVAKLSYQWKDHIKFWLGPKRPYDSTILVIKYEDLKADVKTELKRIMDYLEYPYTEKDIDCAIASNANNFHRHHDSSKAKERFSQLQVDVIYSGIREMGSILKKYNISYEKHVLNFI